jgi:uncharacterized protein involved in type VI secretion and phage assembly
MKDNNKYFGKYRGTVINNLDPQQRGRLVVQVPDVSGLIPTTWAEPCVPLASIQAGVFVLPTVGAGVWVEFEHGDPDFPIWVGGYWGSAAEVPALAQTGMPASPNIVLQTQGQTSIVISDVPAIGITLKTLTGASLIINEAGILLSNGKGATLLMAANTVTINNGALVVM